MHAGTIELYRRHEVMRLVDSRYVLTTEYSHVSSNSWGEEKLGGSQKKQPTAVATGTAFVLEL